MSSMGSISFLYYIHSVLCLLFVISGVVASSSWCCLCTCVSSLFLFGLIVFAPTYLYWLGLDPYECAVSLGCWVCLVYFTWCVNGSSYEDGLLIFVAACFMFAGLTCCLGGLLVCAHLGVAVCVWILWLFCYFVRHGSPYQTISIRRKRV